MKADAVLFGAIGHPKYDNDPTAKVTRTRVITNAKKLGLFANVRPTFTFPL
jgi:3-isopropylmalate dehydrogenase